MAVWSDGRTLLTEGLAYQTTASSLAELLAGPPQPLISTIRPGGNVVEAILASEGLRAFATTPMVSPQGKVIGLFSLCSREWHAFDGDVSWLVPMTAELTASLPADVLEAARPAGPMGAAGASS
jgi:hypothetical protein